MSDARQAVVAARRANAAENAPRFYTDAVSLLDDAAQALKTGDYNGARDQALAARDVALKARGVSVAIEDAARALEEVKSKGLPWREPQGFLEQARVAAEQGDEARALRFAELAVRAAR